MNASAQQDKFTCWSCYHYRVDHCAIGRSFYPFGGPGWCTDFVYDPGSDESERD